MSTQGAAVGQQRRSGVVADLVRRTGLDEARARDAEIGAYNRAIHVAGCKGIPRTWANARFAQVYAFMARTVLCNLDSTSYVGNHRLLTRLGENEFAPHDVAWMRPERLHPDRWRATLDLKAQQDHFGDTARPAPMTDEFRCRACNKRECTYTEMQLRSGDEPMTIFVRCTNCGNSWRRG